jgi:methyl-accepting chemotaxis protein
METSTAQVVQSSQRVEETRAGLEQIIGLAQNVDQLVTEITAATLDQERTTQAVSDQMRSVVVTTQATSQSTEDVRQSLQQTAGVVAELQTSVAKFKV